MPRVSIIIPAYNEHDRLPPSLVRIGEHLATRPKWLPAELVVVDDGSTDRTAEVATRIELPDDIRLVVLSHESNRGKGAAVRTGFASASGKQILLSDADLATPFEELEAKGRGGTGVRITRFTKEKRLTMATSRQAAASNRRGRSGILIDGPPCGHAARSWRVSSLWRSE